MRAISIVFVLIGHLSGTKYFPLPATHFTSHLAEFGVNVFFIISGFLITGLLLAEIEKSGTINLFKFYYRRTLRIFPAYYLYLIILILLSLFSVITLSNGDIFHTLTYTSSYYMERSWYVGHTWSLSVEEQFYLLCPSILLFVGKRRAFWIAVLAVLIFPFIRLGIWQFFPEIREGIGVRFETVADSLAIGCILAGVRKFFHEKEWYLRFLHSKLFLIVLVSLIFVFIASVGRARFNFIIGQSATNLCIVLLIDWCVTNYEGKIGRFLNAKPIAYIGVLSYSIYLWQQPFLNRSSDSFFTSFPQNILFMSVMALLSYYLIENPFLKLRIKLEKRIFSPKKTRNFNETLIHEKSES